jgi:hypothetical protein
VFYQIGTHPIERLAVNLCKLVPKNSCLMIKEVVSIKKEIEYEFLFSICTMVTDMNEYQLMKDSFIGCGFNNHVEFLIVDNSGHNNFNAYEAINAFLQQSKGKYIMMVHQDVRCVDSFEHLMRCLSVMDDKDANWAVCGNAGGSGYKKLHYYLNNNGDIRKTIKKPERVFSLDENLMIVKSSANLSVSADINDFHLYGTDICIIADFLGYSSYVIPFMVTHLSSGNLTQLEKNKPAFIEKYGRKLRSRFIQTTCTKFYLSNSKSKNRFYNCSIVFFIVKPVTRFFSFFK